MSETVSVHNMFSQGLILEFSCIELVIQWTISCHTVHNAKIRASDKDLPVQGGERGTTFIPEATFIPDSRVCLECQSMDLNFRT